MGNNRNNDQDARNIFDRMGGHRGGMLFRNVEEGEWKDPSVIEAKGTFKWYLLVIAAGFMVGTVANFNYLGGIDGIMAMLSQMFEVVWWKTDFVGLLGMIFLPALAILCLFLAFKKGKRHYVESE